MGGGKGRERLDREEQGNEEARVVALLCVLLYKYGFFFSVENPKESFLWLSTYMVHVMSVCKDDVYFIDFDQCAYGLQLPGAKEFCFCRKRTILMTNMQALTALSARCPGVGPRHSHDVAWGGVRINGRWVSKAQAAGVYPVPLCRRWAGLAAEALRERFWDGVAPGRRYAA